MIVNKLNGLRTNYRKEKKVEESTRCGAGSNDIYVLYLMVLCTIEISG